VAASNGGPNGKQVFLGSSQEASKHMDMVAAWLEDEGLVPIPWEEPGLILPGSDLMRQILAKARSSEFAAAAFIFADDDLLNDGQTQPRDNVLIEYGAFAAALGEENTIIIRVGNPKVASDLRGTVYIDLNKKFKAKEQLRPWAKKIRTKKRNIGKLFQTYVDAALCTETTSMGRTEILKCAHEQTLIPAKYLYDSEVGADHWISLCKDPTYGFFRKGLRFWEDEAPSFVQAIKEKIGSEFDFISLGPGDGQKDLEMIRAWDQDEELDVVYYPYDVSLRMIIETVRQIRQSAVPIKLRAVLAEFDNLQQMKAVFDARDAPNVISLLGNSLGNVRNELTFLKNLSSIMNVGDLLLLEVRLHGGKAGLSELNKVRAREFYFSPLKHYLALPFDTKKLNSQPADDPFSKIEGAQSTLICYDDFEFEGESYSDTPLLCINEYDHQLFLEEIREKTSFECVLEMPDEARSFLVCLMQRTKKSGRDRKAKP
jgi:hypothetical protein